MGQPRYFLTSFVIENKNHSKDFIMRTCASRAAGRYIPFGQLFQEIAADEAQTMLTSSGQMANWGSERIAASYLLVIIKYRKDKTSVSKETKLNAIQIYK